MNAEMGASLLDEASVVGTGLTTGIVNSMIWLLVSRRSAEKGKRGLGNRGRANFVEVLIFVVFGLCFPDVGCVVYFERLDRR